MEDSSKEKVHGNRLHKTNITVRLLIMAGQFFAKRDREEQKQQSK
jgi:hypothetical protein